MKASKVESDAALLRHLREEGGATERSAMERRLAADPALARRLAALQAVWSGLELPPTAAPPAGLAGRVLARARGERAAGDGFPGWRRWAPVAALLGGIALGSLGALALPADEGDADEGDTGEEITLAESYLEAVETPGGADEPAAGEAP